MKNSVKALSLMLTTLFALIFNSSNAFQVGFETHDNTPPPPPANPFDNRLISNAPYSLCIKDNIPLDLCTKLGLRLWQTTFEKYGIYDNFYSKFGYNKNTQNVNTDKVQAIVDSYHLPPYIKGQFDVPTPGQLVWLFNNGYVEQGGDGSQYFVRQGAENAIRVAVISEGYFDHAEAKLSRLVTKDIPETCEESACELFQNNKPYYIVFWNGGCNVTWNWRIETIDEDGVQRMYSKNGEGKVLITDKMRKIDVGIQLLSNARAWERDINLRHRQPWTSNECYHSTGCGSSIVNIGDPTCMQRAHGINKIYDISGNRI